MESTSYLTSLLNILSSFDEPNIDRENSGNEPIRHVAVTNHAYRQRFTFRLFSDTQRHTYIP